MLVEQLVNGLMLGSVDALIALGYTLIFGVLGLLHLAHGEVFMVGAFVGLVVTTRVPNIVLAIAAAMLATGLPGVLVERVAFHPLRHAHHLAPLATTIGAGTIRATAEDPTVAGLPRVNTDMVILLTFFVGAALAGAAGVLVGVAYNSVHPFIGVQMGIKGLVVMLLGGGGNVPGAMVAGLLLGVLEVVGAAYLASSYHDAFAFGALMLILLARPEGLLGLGVPRRDSAT